MKNETRKWYLDTYDLLSETLRGQSGCCLDDEDDREQVVRALIHALADN